MTDEMLKKPQDPIDHLTLFGEPEPPAVMNKENYCPFVQRTCICWDKVECKNPNGRCDGG